MPSSTAAGPKFRALQGGSRHRIVPDFIETHRFAAADLTGANSGFLVFQVPQNVRGAVFLGASVSWGTAGTNTLRVKKILNTSAAGAAADANNVDLTAVQDLTLAANTVRDLTALTASAVNVLAPGNRIAVASAAGTASLAGAVISLRLAWL
jgi:hypothetical protein